MTTTNDEALRVFSRLVQKGVKARLIQSNDGFNLADLAEFRYFRRQTMKQEGASVISTKLWNEARTRLCERYSGSACLNDCLALLDAFAATAQIRYKSDFDEFLAEAKIEDFGSDGNGAVVVSTIHKSKGREYDSVYMMLNGPGQITDERRRAIYVGITRAKKALRIHYSDCDLFDGMDVDGIEKSACDSIPRRLSDVIVQLSHKDVVLDFFLDKKSVVVGLRSGDALKVDGTKIRKNRELVRPLLVPVLDKIGTPASSRVENAVRSGSIAVSDFQGAFRKIVTPYISIRADRHSSGPAVNDVPY
jgi:ATP-dependent DNA helicase RecQ